MRNLLYWVVLYSLLFVGCDPVETPVEPLEPAAQDTGVGEDGSSDAVAEDDDVAPLYIAHFVRPHEAMKLQQGDGCKSRITRADYCSWTLDNGPHENVQERWKRK